VGKTVLGGFAEKKQGEKKSSSFGGRKKNTDPKIKNRPRIWEEERKSLKFAKISGACGREGSHHKGLEKGPPGRGSQEGFGTR